MSSTSGGVDYGYADDYMEPSDDHELLLPGLEARPSIGNWRGGDEWLLPGVVGQMPGDDSGEDDDSDDRTPSISSATSSENGDDDEADLSAGAGGSSHPGSACHLTDRYASGSNASVHTPTAAGMHQHDPPWMLQIISAAAAAAAARPGLTEAPVVYTSTSSGMGRREGGGATGGLGGSVSSTTHLRLLPATSLRSSPFGPFGSSSLQHRDALAAAQQHPLTLTVQHHHRFPPSPPRQPHLMSQESQTQLRTAAAGLGNGPGGSFASVTAAGSGGSSGIQGPGTDAVSATGGASGSGGGGASGGGGGGGGGGPTWSFLHTADSSPSSSSSGGSSRDTSPSPPAGRQGQGGGAQGDGPGRANGPGPPPPWVGSQYSNVHYEADFGLGIRMGPAGVSRVGPLAADPSTLPRMRPARRPPVEEPVGARCGGGGGAVAGIDSLARRSGSPDSNDDSFGSLTSGRRNRGSWDGDDGDTGGSSFDGRLQGGPTASGLWPLGVGHSLAAAYGGGGGGGPSASAAAAPSGVGWRVGLGSVLRPSPPQHPPSFAGGRSGLFGSGWRPPRIDTAGTEGSADSTWDPHYGGLSTSTSFGLSTSTSTAILGGNRFTSPHPGHHPPDGVLSGNVGPYLGGPSSLQSGLSMRSVAGGGGGGNGSTRCFTSMDSPVGPYERRRVVLTSAHRRPQASGEPATPAVRQYSEGLAGVLTNAQIQEWMSQHASRLLLPRHMHEIADIVFRPPSAVPEKKPPKSNTGNSPAALLPPPVVLGGRYPPLPVCRLAANAAFMGALLAGLAGVDPTHSRVVTVVTALQGRDVVVLEDEDGEAELQPPPQLLLSPQRLGGKVGRAQIPVIPGRAAGGV